LFRILGASIHTSRVDASNERLDFQKIAVGPAIFVGPKVLDHTPNRYQRLVVSFDSRGIKVPHGPAEQILERQQARI
jgi:hypothetical protein